jgi:hypothetical protein
MDEIGLAFSASCTRSAEPARRPVGSRASLNSRVGRRDRCLSRRGDGCAAKAGLRSAGATSQGRRLGCDRRRRIIGVIGRSPELDDVKIHSDHLVR